MSGVYVEDPIMRIVDVHWKKKKPDGEPDLGPPYCGRYGWGSIVAEDSAGIGSAPYGPNQFIPFVGTFSTTKADPVYGSLQPTASSMMTPVDPMTAVPGGDAQFIRLYATTLVFTTGQLIFIQDLFGRFGSFGWTVPMARGQNADGVAMVIKTYTIRMEWHSAFVDPLDEVGIGISHPLPGIERPAVGPPEPAVVLGPSAGGAESFVYDFKYDAWSRGEITVTPGNQYDPSLGGPATLWWMERRKTGTGYTPWGASLRFMASVLVGLGDWATWEIVAGCQPIPNYVPPG